MRGATPRALVTSAPVSTSTVQRVPTVSDLRMVDQAALAISNKLITALRRNPGVELAIQSSMLDNAAIYSNLLTTLVGSEDTHFSQAILAVQEHQRVMTESFDNLNSYNRRAMVNGGNTRRVVPDYLTSSFIKDVLTTLCSSYEGFNWSELTQALTIHTENITLRATIHGTQYVVPMGRFRIVWNLRNFDGSNGSPSQFTIFSLDNMHAENAENIIHPHVMNNLMCPGNSTTGVQASLPAALNGGRIVDAFDQIDCLLHNYGPSPYLRLELWGNHLCPGCNLSVARTEMVHCFQCDASHCRGCSKECTDCGRWYCKERCGTYDRVARTYSCPCALNTVRCVGIEDPATGCHLRFNPSTPAGVIEPQTGYCQRCLFLWINGTVPRPAVVHQATIPEPVAPPVRTRRRRSGTLLGVETILTPEEFVPVFSEQAASLSVAEVTETIAAVAAPAALRRSGRTDFPGTFDDLLDAQVAQSTQTPEGLLREMLVIIDGSAAAPLTEPLVTNAQESNSDVGLFASDQLLAYQTMFEDMAEHSSVALGPGVSSLEIVSVATSEQENVEVQAPVLTEDQIRQANDDQVEELIRLSAGSRSILRAHREQTEIAARNLASVSEDARVIGNANRYLDPTIDRWVTR